jgi:sensor histidine kinase regulating citrate/malate metabolism
MNAIEVMSSVHDLPREPIAVSRKDGADAVLIEVRDSGHWLHAQPAEQVFEPPAAEGAIS